MLNSIFKQKFVSHQIQNYECMETYSMTQVETLTGINAHTLRIWERRYSFLKPERTATNIRMYSNYELKKLLNISILNRNGYRISTIDKLTNEEIESLVTSILSNITDSKKDEIDALTIAMVEYDEESFHTIYNRSVLRNGFLFTVKSLIYPFLNHIGILWGTNKAIPSQEHFISNLIRQKIITSIDSLPQPLNSAPAIVMFLLEGEDHELGLLVSYFIAKDLGWQVYYLGQRVPCEDLKHIAKVKNVQLQLTMLFTPRTENFNTITKKIVSENNIPLLVSGNELSLNSIEKHSGMVLINNPTEFIKYLEENTEILNKQIVSS